MAVPIPTRWQYYRSIAVFVEWQRLAWRDDRKLTAEDIDETLLALGLLGLIWAPQIIVGVSVSTTPLLVIEAAIVTGAIASYAIGGVEGVETYVDFITDPVDIVKDPEKLDAFLQASEITLGIVNPVAWVGGQIGQYAGKKIAEYKKEIFRNRFLTGPYLPF